MATQKSTTNKVTTNVNQATTAGVASGATPGKSSPNLGTNTATTPAIQLPPLIDLTPITSLISSLQGLWDWLANPLRIVKLFTGIALIGVSFLLLVSPDDINMNDLAGVIGSKPGADRGQTGGKPGANKPKGKKASAPKEGGE